MRNFVISLTSAYDRREHINKEFNKHKVNFEFFDALTPKNVQEYIHSSNLPFSSVSKHLTSTETACMMSHIAIWRKAVDESIPYITVFEDDIYLGLDADYYLNNSCWIQPDWHIIKIETVNKKVLLDKNKIYNLQNDRKLIPLKGKHLGAGAYTLSLQGVKKLLAYITQRTMLPIDEMVFRDYILDKEETVYQMVPALCIQDIIIKTPDSLIFESSLEEERSERMRFTKRTKIEKLTKEVGRVLEKAKYSTHTEKVPLK